jgi:uncharacterized protein YbgA (DUF1722 family)/uncharacterized protein YbbK (DUF523 family)
MKEFPKPIIVVSRCLGFEAVRYDGAIIHDDFAKKLSSHVKFITVCPEVEIGLGVPREPIRIIESDSQRRLVQPATGRDFTVKMNRFSDKFLKSLSDVDGFIMKSRSPSSGIKDVKIYSGKPKSPIIGKGAGFFGGKILELFPDYPVEDEGRLLNLKIREHFLIRIFALASFRKTVRSEGMKELVKYHSENKLLLLSHNQKEMRLLGKIVANHERNKTEKVISEYEKHLRLALLRPAREGANINTMMHAMGYFSDRLTSREKNYFLKELDNYKRRRITFPAVAGILQSWVLRFEETYLQNQTFFEPFPEELLETSDSGKGRDI